MGQTYSAFMLSGHNDGLKLTQVIGGREGDPRTEAAPERTIAEKFDLSGKIWLRVTVEEPAWCRFWYSVDGKDFAPWGEPFKATPGHWIGAKVGVVCQGEGATADFESFEIE